MKREWQIQKPDMESIKKIYNELNCHPITATILANRNILSPEDAHHFLNPSLTDIRPPFFMKDVDKAVNRIIKALNNKEKILIFGDYDVDGITGTAVLYELFQYIGADISYYIPHRINEGYGIQTNHIFDYAVPNAINLIITVDCGSTSYDATEAAQKEGIDVIITDHHHISDEIPKAFAVLNPKRKDCEFGFTDLAGVGVAFFLLVCLRKKLRDLNFWKTIPEPNLKNSLDLVALGTIADMVPLISENRIIAKTGLDIINSNCRPGIKALVETCGIKNRMVDTEDVAFRLAPRLNAAGRVDHASIAFSLLTTKDYNLAVQLSDKLNQMNSIRQEMEKEILNNIIEYLTKNPDLLQKRSIVLSSDSWHEGVLGIIASKLIEKYYRPVILISTRSGSGKGSARSIQGVDMYKALLACSENLERFGGHSKAAGLKINPANIKKFSESFECFVKENTKSEDFIKTILIDYELNFDKISDQLINELESLMPFGSGNNEPLFMARNVRVSSSSIVGRNHRRMLLKQPQTNTVMNAIHFNINKDLADLQNKYDQIAFRLHWNRWNGKKNPQIIIEEI